MKAMLKKYKDKLYTFLVLKNSAIASEYQAYVMADTERHEKHKLKSWLFLLKLNWKYRVLRGKQTKNTEKKQGNQPYLKGPESELSNRPLPIYLAKRLMKYDIISFDIFDTLILRPFDKPVTVFDLIGNKLSITNFKEHRINAEREVRRKKMEEYGTKEITIFDIYRYLYDKSIILNINEAIEAEIETELDVCLANPYMKEIFYLIKDHNKDIYLLSDMYLPKKYLVRLLSKCGYYGYKDIFVSCEHTANKASGNLFKILKEKIADSNKKIIHIGDNYTADIQGSKKENIDSFHYKGVNEYGNKYRCTSLTSLIGSAYRGIINAKLHATETKYSIFYETGLIYGGILFLGYTEYIKKIYQDFNFDKLLLLSRDSYIIDKILDLSNNNINYSYCYHSRNIAQRACTIEDFYSFVERITLYSLKESNNSYKTCTIGELFDEYEITFLLEYLIGYELHKDDIVDRQNIEIIRKLLHEHREQIIAQQKQYRLDYIKYLSNLIGDSKKILIADIGWTGTSMEQMRKFIANNFKETQVHSILLGNTLNHDSFLLEQRMYSYVFNSIKNHDIKIKTNKLVRIFIEMLSTAPEPSIVSISNSNFIFGTVETENKNIYNQINTGIMDFIKEYYKSFKEYSYMNNIPDKDSVSPLLFVLRHIKNYYHYFSDIKIAITTSFNDYELNNFEQILKKEKII